MGRRAAATWLALAALLAAPAARAQSELAIARERFERGADLFAHERYAEALEEYRASLAAYASPNSRLAIARCLERLGRDDEAVAEYEVAARDAADRAGSDPRYANTRETAEAELARLRPHVAQLRVRATNGGPQTRVTVRDRVLPSAALGLPVPVLPGATDVLVESPGFLPARRAVVLEAGRETALDVTLEPAPTPVTRPVLHAGPTASRERVGAQPSGALRVAAWTAVVVGAAGLAAWGGFGLWANGEYAALDQSCGPSPCPLERQGDVTLGETLQTLTNASLGVGIAGASAALALWIALAATDTHAPRVACAGPWCGAAIAF